MKIINRDQLLKELKFPEIIKALAEGFCQDFTVPPRPHFHYENHVDDTQSSLLFMPAWGMEGFMGLKIVTVTPGNHRRNLPTIQGSYLLLDMVTGDVIAQIDATTLTYLRTACTSAVASNFLSRENSSKLLMVGTGGLVPYLISAHASVRPIEKVMIWGRNYEKAAELIKTLNKPAISIYPVRNLNAAIPEADIISTATLSKRPLIKGSCLVPGQHLDLVGSYRADMREADDQTIRKASIFIDTNCGMVESGDLKQPLDAGVIREENIKGDIFNLCRREVSGRRNQSQLTLFKSVGHASQDLIVAVLAYRKLFNDKTITHENGNK